LYRKAPTARAATAIVATAVNPNDPEALDDFGGPIKIVLGVDCTNSVISSAFCCDELTVSI